MLPSIFGEDLFDDMFEDMYGMRPFFGNHNPVYGKHAKNLMKSDVRETEDAYELDIDLPGFKKDEINLKLDQGLPDHLGPPRAWTRTTRTRTAGTSAASATPAPAAAASMWARS